MTALEFNGFKALTDAMILALHKTQKLWVICGPLTNPRCPVLPTEHDSSSHVSAVVSLQTKSGKGGNICTYHQAYKSNAALTYIFPELLRMLSPHILGCTFPYHVLAVLYPYPSRCLHLLSVFQKSTGVSGFAGLPLLLQEQLWTTFPFISLGFRRQRRQTRTQASTRDF